MRSGEDVILTLNDRIITTSLKNLRMAREPSLEELIALLRNIQIQEATVIAQIQRVNERQTRRHFQARSEGAFFEVGDRVTIINTVRAGQVRTGTVTRVSGERVYLVTDNGINTWRLKENLVKRG